MLWFTLCLCVGQSGLGSVSLLSLLLSSVIPPGLITLGLLTSDSQFAPTFWGKYHSQTLMSELTAQLSLVTSEEYKQWKSDTLATQNSHNVEIVQTQQESERRKVRLRGHRTSLCTSHLFRIRSSTSIREETEDISRSKLQMVIGRFSITIDF